MSTVRSVRRLGVATVVCMLPFLAGCPQVDTNTDGDGPNGPRAVSGACCLSDELCEELTLDFCVTTAGGVFQGAGTECGDIICKGVVATGACCVSDELCEELSQESCAATVGGVFQGAGTECDGSVCAEAGVTGACCLEDGTCLALSTSACTLGGGEYQGDDVSCDVVECAVESPVGACCLDEGCIDNPTEAECDGLGGAYQGDGTACTDSDIACGPDTGTVPKNDLAESNPNVAFGELRSGDAVALTAPKFATLTRINEGCSCAWSSDGDGTFAPQSGESACETSYTPAVSDSSITVVVTCLEESRTGTQTVQVVAVAQVPPGNPGGGGGGGGGGTTDPCAGVTCNDNEACTADACVGGTCVFTNLADGTTCSDGNECTVNDRCVAGTCTTESLPDGVECTQDGVFCNGREVCTAGACESSGPPCGSLSCNDTDDRCEGCADASDCPDDGNDCTDVPTCDTSGATNFCVYPAFDNTTACEDGNPCTTNDLCDGAGSCVSGGAVDCSVQDDACNIGVCNLADGTCVAQATNEGLACNDGNACTEGTSCTAGTCGGGTGIVCDDADACTVDSCDPTTGCQASDPCSVATPTTPFCDQNNGICVECLINNDCNVGFFCDSNNSCQPGTPVSGNIFRGDYPLPTTVVTCAVDNDCAFKATNSGVTCADDTECVGVAGFPVCDNHNTTSGKCVECITDGDCTGGAVCELSNHTCGARGLPVCDTGQSVCVGCVVDGDCPTGSACINNTCGAGGRTIRVEVRRGDENGTVLATADTNTGAYQVIIPNAEFAGGAFTGTITVDSTFNNVRPAAPINNVSLAMDTPVTGQDLTVFYDIFVATTGDDTNTGTQAAPFALPQRAADDAFPGDVVTVAAGTYVPGGRQTPVGSAAFHLFRDGTASRRIRFQANPLPQSNVPDTALPQYAVPEDTAAIDVQFGVNNVIVITADYVDLIGFSALRGLKSGIRINAATNVLVDLCSTRDIDSDAEQGNGSDGFGIRVEGSQNITIQRCTATRCNRGIAFGKNKNPANHHVVNTNSLIDRCHVFNIFDPINLGENGQGFQVSGHQDNITFRRCVSHDNSDNGFGGNFVFNSTFDRNVVFDMNTQNSTNGDAEGIKIGVGAGANNVFRNNTVFNVSRAFDDASSIGSVFVHNTTVGNDDGIFSPTDNATVYNNILVDNSVAPLGNFTGSDINFNCYDNSFAPVGASDITLDSGDPLFSNDPPVITVDTDVFSANFAQVSGLALVNGSPCLESGTFLTTVASNGTGVTTITVGAGGTRFFRVGDQIEINNAGSDRVVITALDGTANTITLDTAVTVVTGDGVALPWTDTVPDRGSGESNGQ